MENEHTTIALMKQDLEYIRKAIDEMKISQRMFVTKAEFLPIKMIVYGFVCIILTGVVGFWVTRSLRAPVTTTVTNINK